MDWEGPLTHRQYEVWMMWMAMEWDFPSTTDHYLMQIACEIRRGYVKNPRSVKLSHFNIDFGTKPPKKPKDPKLVAEQAKARWVGWMGMAVTVVKAEKADTNGTSGSGSSRRSPER